MNPTPALRADTESRLRDIFAGVLGITVEEVGPALNRTTARGWSSLNHLLLISEVELRFNVAFTNTDIAAATTYADVRDVLARRLRTAAGE